MQRNYTKWINSSFLEENEKEIILGLSETKKMNVFQGILSLAQVV